MPSASASESRSMCCAADCCGVSRSRRWSGRRRKQLSYCLGAAVSAGGGAVGAACIGCAPAGFFAGFFATAFGIGPRLSSRLAMHLAMNALRLAPANFWSSAPNLQVSIFCALVTADAGLASRRKGRRLMAPKVRNIDMAPLRIAKSVHDSTLPQCRCNIATIDRRYIGGGLERQRLGEKGLRHVLSGDFAAKQVPRHIILRRDPARRRALFDEAVGENPGADTVGIDRIGADAVGAVVECVLPHQK